MARAGSESPDPHDVGVSRPEDKYLNGMTLVVQDLLGPVLSERTLICVHDEALGKVFPFDCHGRH
jgi:hypothetical protein